MDNLETVLFLDTLYITCFRRKGGKEEERRKEEERKRRKEHHDKGEDRGKEKAQTQKGAREFCQ